MAAEETAMAKALYKAVAVAVTLVPAVAVILTPPTDIEMLSPVVLLATVAIIALAVVESPVEAEPTVTEDEVDVALFVNVTVPSLLSTAV